MCVPPTPKPYVEALNLNVMVSGGEVRLKLGFGSGNSWWDYHPYKSRKSEVSTQMQALREAFWAHTARWWLSLSQEKGSLQELKLLAPWSWTFQPLDLWETNVHCLSHRRVYGILLQQPQLTKTVSLHHKGSETIFESWKMLSGVFNAMVFIFGSICIHKIHLILSLI